MNKKLSPRQAVVDISICAACGSCMDICPFGAIAVYRGSYARVNAEICRGCGKCAQTCPASAISLEARS